MPPLQALVALHGLWCLGFLPLVVWAIRSWPARRLWFCGQLLTYVAALGFGLLVSIQMSTWFPKVSAEYRQYLPQRVAYVIGTSPELPLGQSLMAGVVCWVAGRRRLASRGAQAAPVEKVGDEIPAGGGSERASGSPATDGCCCRSAQWSPAEPPAGFL
jgi:hypothetical protein